MRLLAGAVVCVALAAVAGCGNGADPGSPPSAASRPVAAPASSARTSTIVTRASPYGRILTDGRGRTLYVFTRETTGHSRCYGACAKSWPPLLARPKPHASGGARARLIGTTRRRDGSVQATYAGHPLYRYVRDRKAGQILCQNVVEFGGTWLVADAQGRPVRGGPR